MEYLLSIDAGTGSIRAVLFDTDGKQVAIEQKEWTHKEDERYANSYDFDYETNWKKAVACIQGVLQKSKVNPESIKALSASSMREAIIAYDKDGKEIWGVSNVDSRASEQVKWLRENHPGFEKECYEKSGQTFALGALPRLLWLKNYEPDIYEKVHTISMLSEWVLAKLSGVIASEPSNSGTTGIYHLQTRDWDKAMMEKIGLKSDIFPPTFESGTSIGKVSASASKQTGLSQKTQVVLGGGDVQVGCLGLGLVHPYDCAVLGGSFWQQVINLQKPVNDKHMNIRFNPHVVSQMTQAEAITFFSGLVMRWFKEAFAKDISYDALEVMARGVPVGSRDIIPIFSDQMKYGKWYHAAPSFLNLRIDPEICGIPELYRSLMENAAIVSANNLESITALTGIDPDAITFAAGASQSDLWCQILSDVTAKVINVPVEKEATSLGCAILAGVGSGIFESYEDGCKKLIKWEKQYMPNMQNHTRYKQLRTKWQEVYKSQLDLVDRGLTEPMWKAPGV